VRDAVLIPGACLAISCSHAFSPGRQEQRMDNWERAEQFSHRESSSQWLKLANDGDRAVVVFVGEPHPREVVFDAGGYHTFTPEHEARGLKPTFRFPINVAVLPNFEVKVLEVGASLMRDVLRVKKKYSLETWAYEVVRRGAAKDPKTTYDLLPEQQLTAEEQRRVGALKLLDLVALYDGRAETAAAPAPVPIDDPTAKDLVERLRALPRPAVDAWLHEMKIARVRELTTDRLAEARTRIKQLADHAKAPSADPFA
jgi:hypothetical protein